MLFTMFFLLYFSSGLIHLNELYENLALIYSLKADTSGENQLFKICILFFLF